MTVIRDRKSAWSNTAFADTIFLRADFKAQRFDPHSHDEYAIGVIDSGCQAFTYDRGRRLDMPQGSVALIAPGIVHAGWPGADEGWRYRMFYPNTDLVRQASRDVFGPQQVGTFSKPVVDDTPLRGMLSKLHDKSASPDADALELERLFLGVVHLAFSSHAGVTVTAPKSGPVPGIQMVRDLMEARYADALSLNELAAVVSLTKFSLLRQFKATFGLPPHAFLKQIRVRRASEMIRAGNSLAQTALLSGFSDQAHMTRTFKRILGYTPGLLTPTNTRRSIEEMWDFDERAGQPTRLD